MVHMLRKTAAIDQDVVEEDQDKSTKNRLKEVIQRWKGSSLTQRALRETRNGPHASEKRSSIHPQDEL